MTLLPVSCARADTYVQESGDARVLSHRPTPSHADLVGPSPVRLDGVEPTTLCGNLNISLIWPSNARYSEPVLNISRNGFIIITRIQNRRAQRLDIDQTMRYPHTPRGDTHHRHIRTPGSRTQLNTTKSPRRPPRPSSRQPAPRRAPRTTRLTPPCNRNRSRIPANRGSDDNATATQKGDPFIHQPKGHHPPACPHQHTRTTTAADGFYTRCRTRRTGTSPPPAADHHHGLCNRLQPKPRICCNKRPQRRPRAMSDIMRIWR